MTDFDNSGALFKNDRKERDNHPDYTGNAKVDGVEYWISAWVREKNGRKYFSLAYKPKEYRLPSPQRGSIAITSGKADPIDDEDVPF